MEGLESLVALPDVPDPLPGEDSGFGDGLFVDLVPMSCWFTNVRTCVDRRDWERLRHTVYAGAGPRCEICRADADRTRKEWLERAGPSKTGTVA